MTAKASKSMRCTETFLSTSQFVCNCMQTYKSGCRSFLVTGVLHSICNLYFETIKEKQKQSAHREPVKQPWLHILQFCKSLLV